MPTSDTTPPVLTGLTLPGTVNLAGGTAAAVFGLSASDVGAGVLKGYLTLDHSYHDAGGLEPFIGFEGDFASGAVITRASFDGQTAAGVYNVTGLYISDRAGNTTYYSAAQLTVLGFATHFEVQREGVADSTPPVLTGLTLPGVVNVSAGTVTPAFTLTASDAGAGVLRALLTLDHSFHDAFGLEPFIAFEGDAASGALTAHPAFDAQTAPGVYGVTGAYVTDRAGNTAYYSPAQLKGLGLATSFTVQASAAADSTPPLLTGLTLPGTVSLAGGAATGVFGLAASDLGAGLQRAFLTLDHAFHDAGGLELYVELGGDFAAGRLSAAVAFDSQTTNGAYTVTGAYVTDRAGNTAYYATSQLKGLGLTTSFTITDGAAAPVETPAPVAVFSAAHAPQAVADVLRVAADTGAAAQLAAALAGAASAGLPAADALRGLVIAAAGTTSVATLAYEFFTGRTPSSAGIDYLVSPAGANPNNLNSAYYQGFSLENRYINFAVNLGRAGEGAAAFSAAYGSKSLFDATKAAYAVIFGATPSDQKVHDILDPVLVSGGRTLTRADYFASYGGDGPDGLGAKAAAVGWLLTEAVKADLGTYARANDAFLLDVAQTGAAFGVDLVGKYAKPEFAFHG